MFDQMKALMEMKKKAEGLCFDKLSIRPERAKRVEGLKRELDASSIEVSDVRGIKIIVSGSQNFRSLEISPELLAPENQKGLENDLLRALNSAIKKSQNLAAQKMQVMTGLNIPWLN